MTVENANIAARNIDTSRFIEDVLSLPLILLFYLSSDKLSK